VPIRPFLKEAVFGPDIISAMGIAFEDTWGRLQAADRSDVTKEMIAAMIIGLAQGGKTDPIVLRELVLSEFGLSQSAGET
jgi:hypothetical protein